MKQTHERPVCHRAEDLVSYLYGEAGPTDALDFGRHLQQCDACRSEFTAFNQLHSSIQDWRGEALGASFNPAAAANPGIEATPFARHERKLSALAALREFFSVSPLWLRGATAFAGLLLCVLGIMMVARVERRPPEIVKTGKAQRVYSDKEFETAVNQAVDKKVQELTARKENLSAVPASKPKPASPNRPQLAADRQSKNRQRGLNRQEREQLAADLRLTSPADEEELQLVLPEQEHPNQ
ncbi:MAG TPA: zf-HC2 domain-containing protein [Pyrinomonadaceae bacterium]|nr:zf-HC2 domain-containing protein [Pyrinomonadaceae bacterium]